MFGPISLAEAEDPMEDHVAVTGAYQLLAVPISKPEPLTVPPEPDRYRGAVGGS